MTSKDSAPIGAPCWIDLMTSDTERARDFYCALFGWEAGEADPNFGGYFMFTRNGVPIGGGMSKMADSTACDAWSVYLATEDAEATIEAATARGAKLIVPKMAVADLGTMAMLADPGGAAIGMWQPGNFAGFGVLAESGAPSWFQLNTQNYDGAVGFYREVFHLDAKVESDTAEFRYTTLTRDQEPVAGIMDALSMLGEDAQSRWVVFFGTDDADATTAKVVELGGQVVRPAEDTPYGRLAVATDPTGAMFSLVAPNEAVAAR